MRMLTCAAIVAIVGCTPHPAPLRGGYDMRSKLLLVMFIGMSAISCATPDGPDPARCDQLAQSSQPTCGNGSCTARVDKNGNDYCTCKGRKGRAKLACCGL